MPPTTAPPGPSPTRPDAAPGPSTEPSTTESAAPPHSRQKRNARSVRTAFPFLTALLRQRTLPYREEYAWCRLGAWHCKLYPRPPHHTGAPSPLWRRNHNNPFNRSEEHTSELQSLRHLVCR